MSEKEKMAEAESEALREVHTELLEQLKRLTQATYGLQIGPMSEGIATLIQETRKSEEIIRKFDPDFELIPKIKNDKH